MIKVSVIIPVYNVQKYIEECLQSVTGQTLQEIEIICINDKSTDSSWEKVKSLAEKDNRIVLFENEKNRGLSYNRNKGLLEAHGEYVYMLDSDDTIKENALEELYQLCQTEGLEVVSFGASSVFETEGLKRRFCNYRSEFRHQYTEKMTGKELFKLWMEQQDWVSMVQRFFYKKEFLEKNSIRFIDGILHEDQAFTFEVLMKALAVKCIPEHYFNRRLRAGSIMTSEKTSRNMEGYLFTLWRIFQLWRMQQEDDALNHAIWKYVNQIYQYAVSVYLLLEEQFLTEGFESSYEPVNILFSILKELNMGENGFRITQGQEIYQKLNKVESVYIYGAGIYARRAITFLDRMQIAVKGLLVKEKENNPRAVCGIKVYELEEIKECTELIIIGVSNKFREEVLDLLTERGFRNILELKL